MRNLKKVLSTIMAVAMMMSLVVFNTSAAFNDQDKIVNTDAVNMNVALGIINGLPDGTFNPAGNVTRAEMAKMICIVLNGGKEPAVSAKAGAATFTDIRGHWAEGYIEYCVASGIVAGMGDGTFAPNANVTATQAAKMLLVALGYDAAFEGFNGSNWNVKINVAASQKNLYEDVVVTSVNNPLSRDNAAQMVWNALNAKEVKYTYSLTTVNGQLQNVQVREDKTTDLLATKFNTNGDFTGIMTAYKWNTTDKKFDYTIYTGDSKDAENNVVHNTTKFQSATDYTALFGLNVNVVYKDTSSKTVYGMYADDSKVLATGVVGDLAKTTTKGEIKFDGVKYDVDYAAGNDATATLNNLPVYAENVWAYTADTYATAVDFEDAYEARLIDSDNNGDADYLVYLPFTYGQVTSVATKTVYTDGDGAAPTSMTFADNTIYTGVAEDDYVKVIATANSAYKGYTVTKMDSFTGTVDSLSADDVKVAGKTYTFGTDAVGDALKAKESYTFYAVGSYVYYTDEADGANLDDVLFVATAAKTIGTQAKAYFVDGTSKVIDVKAVKTDAGTEVTPLEGAAITAMAGTLYTYTVKNGEYTLTQLGDDNLVSFKDYDSGAANSKISEADGNLVGKMTVNAHTYNIADNAVIFILKNDDSVKVVTGTVAKNYAADVIGTKGEVLYDTVSGNNAVKLGAITLADAESIPSSNGETGNYGYVLGDPRTSKDDNGDTIYTFSMWNGKANVDVFTSDDIIGKVKEGDAISYTDLGSNELGDIIALYTGNGALAAGDTVLVDAVKGIDGKTLTILDTAAASVKDDYYLTSDTKYLYVDTDTVEGVDTGSIRLMNKVTNEKNVLIYVDNADNEIALIVVDVNNDYAAPSHT